MDNSGRYITVYIIMFDTYGSGDRQASLDGFKTREAALEEVIKLSHCGHTNIDIVPVNIHQN